MSQKKASAVAVIFNPERSKVLLVKRRDIPVFVLPGGGIDEGEDPAKAAVREGEEETSCRLEMVKKVGEYFPRNRLSRHTHLFELRILSGEPRATNETLEARFFPLRELPSPLAPPHIEWIREAALSPEIPLQREITSCSYRTLFRALILHPQITLRFLLTRLGIHLNR